MKLIATQYKNHINKGIYNNVIVTDDKIIIARDYISISFVMRNDELILGEQTLTFTPDSYQPTMVQVPKVEEPTEEPTEEGTDGLQPVSTTIEFFELLKTNSNVAQHFATTGTLPEGYYIIDYGYPTNNSIVKYFTGGTFADKEIHITNPLAIGFVLSKLEFFGEAVGVQFNF